MSAHRETGALVAAAQSRALGADASRVFVAHPIQDRTDDEIRALADGAVDAVLRALRG